MEQIYNPVVAVNLNVDVNDCPYTSFIKSDGSFLSSTGIFFCVATSIADCIPLDIPKSV